jgi:16S rRNA G966 N2-methylase RsmD
VGAGELPPRAAGGRYNFIFAGPPYALGNIDDLPGAATPLLAPEGMFVLEHTPRNSYKTYPYFRQERSYGTTVFSFFKAPEASQ